MSQPTDDVRIMSVESVPAPETRWQRLVRRVLRRPAPTRAVLRTEWANDDGTMRMWCSRDNGRTWALEDVTMTVWAGKL